MCAALSAAAAANMRPQQPASNQPQPSANLQRGWVHRQLQQEVVDGADGQREGHVTLVVEPQLNLGNLGVA
jgi:hypothetical protein